jgi:hypothetical protein
MKLISAIFVTAFLAYVIGIYTTLPWWSFAISSFVVALAIPQKPFKAFITGFLGLCIVWVVLSVMKDLANEHILSTKVAQILPLGGSFVVLILLTGILGGLVSGLSALAGSYVRQSK